MTTYVRRKGGDTWHFMSHCSKMPHGAVERKTQASRPRSGELCDECLAKEREQKKRFGFGGR